MLTKCTNILHAFSLIMKRKASECYKHLSLITCPVPCVASGCVFTQLSGKYFHFVVSTPNFFSVQTAFHVSHDWLSAVHMNWRRERKVNLTLTYVYCRQTLYEQKV